MAPLGAAGPFPLLFAALTGRSGHGLARMKPDSLTHPLGLWAIAADQKGEEPAARPNLAFYLGGSRYSGGGSRV